MLVALSHWEGTNATLRFKEAGGRGEARSLARPHDWEEQESAGRSLGCSELKTGGIGFNTLMLLFIPFSM